jgi:hypothetical protein
MRSRLLLATAVALSILSVVLTGCAQNLVEIHVRYWSQYDANEVWLVHYDESGAEVKELVTSDITTFVPGKTDYLEETVVYAERLHDPSDAPPITPYYVFQYKQQKVEFSGNPVYYPDPIESVAFAVGVNHLGQGYELLRETMFIFDATPSPNSRFEQVYRGPDQKLYVYRPGGGSSPVLLQTLIDQGYGAYNPSDFQ